MSSETTPDADARPAGRGAARLSAALLAVLVWFVASQLSLGEVFSTTTPTGGDVAAHVWFPRALRDMLPQLNGWSDDWFAGFPVGTFYFPLPALLVAVLDLALPYETAFKVVLVSGSMLLAPAAYRAAAAARLPHPTPAMFAAAAVVFLFDEFHTIYGGNVAASAAGMFSVSLGTALALFALGDLFEVLDGRRARRWRCAVLAAAAVLCHLLAAVFLAVLAVAAVAAHTQPRRAARAAAGPLVAAALLAAPWWVPFAWNVDHSTGMGYEPVGSVGRWLVPASNGDLDGPRPWHTLMLLALPAAAVLARRRRWRPLAGFAAAAAMFAALFVAAPASAVWNPRFLPPYYLLGYLCAAGVVAAALGTLRSPRWRAAATVFAVVAVSAPAWGPSGVVPGTQRSSNAAAWMRWDLQGYESRDGWEEYRRVIDTMDRVGAQRGCGRALWEYDPAHADYGSPMAMMLLPYWTDGCIGSLEGLFSESSRTAPYHFVVQSLSSQNPSHPVRGAPYGRFDLDRAVPAMRQLGVRYYMAYNPTSVLAANRHPELVPVAAATPWQVYELAGYSLVEAFDRAPVVLEGEGQTRLWEAFAEDPSHPVAHDGPPHWRRARSTQDTRRIRGDRLEPVEVSRVRADGGTVSFQVDRVGVPVLVRVSHFPSWQATGADGPWPAGPNMMVVVPHDRTVELHAGAAPGTALGWVLGATGLAAVAALAARPRAPVNGRRRR